MAPGKRRTIRSFVRRAGRMTVSQERALAELWPTFGIGFAEDKQDFDKVFGRRAKRILEIGFGNGESLVDAAARNPDKDFIGIEVHEPGVGACLMAAEDADVTNLRLFNDDAVEVLEQCIADESLQQVQIFFPDPWHKKRHHKRRLIQPEFVAHLCKKLKPNGVIHLATDWENYAEHMLEVLSGEPRLSNLSTAGDFIPRPEERPKTKFEQRGETKGHGVWDLKFQKAK